MRDRYLMLLKESLLLFFQLRPELSIIETTRLTQYGRLLNENNEYIKKQRYLYNRKDKTFKLSYVLNQSIDDNLIDDFIDLYQCDQLVFKTNINPSRYVLLMYKGQPAFRLMHDRYILNLNHTHRFNQLLELDDNCKVVSKSINKYMHIHVENDTSLYTKTKDVKYSLIETMTKTSFRQLIDHYKSLYYYLEAVIYELFSIVQYSDCYSCDFELLDGLQELIKLLSYDYYQIDNENVLEEIKKQLLKTLPFEVHQSLIDDDCYIDYLNDYIKEFIVRKKDSLYLSQVNYSIDELEESDKGEKYNQNKYMMSFSNQNTREKNEDKEIDIDNYDLDMSILQLEKNIINYLKQNMHLSSSFVYELTQYAYDCSLTSKGILNKHGSAYNWAIYILRMIQQLYMNVESNEEEYVASIKGSEHVLLEEYLKNIDIDAYKYNLLSSRLSNMVDSNQTDIKKYDCISRARNHQEDYKRKLLNMLIYVQNEQIHKEKLNDFKNGDAYIDIMNMCVTHISKSEFLNKYIQSFLKLVDDKLTAAHLFYAYYLKHIKDYSDFMVFKKYCSTLSIEEVTKDLSVGDVLLFKSELDFDELSNMERSLVENKILTKVEYMIIHEVGIL